MLEKTVYFVSFIVSTFWIIEILKQTELPKYFKPNAIWHIRSAYIIITLIGAHLFASMIVQVFNLF